jgi:uncharacterized membrane protein YeaQ/YmgE (transglycosylase-associated protein family)
MDFGGSMTFLWWIVVGLIAGWITGKIMGSGHGVLVDILVGIAGALFGGWVMRMLGFAGHGGTIYTILVATGGAVILTWLYRLISRRGGRPSDQGKGDSDIRRAA